MARRINLYFADGQNEARLLITPDGETEITICRRGQLRFLSLDEHTKGGRLDSKKQSTSARLLIQIGRIIAEITLDRNLWYEATDSRREKIYQRAFCRAGIKVTQESCITILG